MINRYKTAYMVNIYTGKLYIQVEKLIKAVESVVDIYRYNM